MRNTFRPLLACSLFALISLAGCTDAERAKLAAFGSGGSVTCYSGDRVIYDGRATGKIRSEQTSDGYYFRDAETDKLVEVSGNCVIRYGEGSR